MTDGGRCFLRWRPRHISEIMTTPIDRVRSASGATPAAEGGGTSLHAVILAGGRGTRLRPFTVNFPKPLVPLGDTPVIEVLMGRLVRSGITDITLTLGHMAALMRAYFEQRQELTSRVRLRYVEEVKPTGTAGSVALVPGLTDTFLVMNGDLLTDLDFRELVAHHRREGAMLTIAAHRRRVKVDLGVLDVGPDGMLRDYLEKPEHAYQVSMGIYVYEPAVLAHIPPGEYLDLPQLAMNLVRAGEKVAVYESDCLWLDIGRPDDYARAQELFAEQREAFERI